MRSTKNRSRGKPNNRNNNNNRSAGSVINRVFDSSGPEGKVRGTPQQIIEKYDQLMRDAQLANDRVAAENFQQHAEHYNRILGAAQKELDAQREQQEREQQERRERQESERIERNERQERHANERRQRNEQNAENTSENNAQSNVSTDRDEDVAAHSTPPRAVAAGEGEQPDVSFVAPSGNDDGATLVETTEQTPKPKRARAPRKPRVEVDAAPSEAPAVEVPTAE